MDKWLKASIMVAVLLAGAGVFYHFVFFLPEVMQANRDKDEADKSEGSPASARRAAYEECRQGAHLAYDVHWASACMFDASEAEAKHAACLRDPARASQPDQGKAHCDRVFERHDGAADCTLPAARAAAINAFLKEAEDKCRMEARAGAAP